MTLLSPHFSFEELIFSEIALRKGLDNTPDAAQRMNLSRLCALALEPARDILGVPIHVNSGFRSTGVNAAVGGAANSSHMAGLAADILPIGVPLLNAFNALRTNLKGLDQIIQECGPAGWIHLSIPEGGDTPRGQALLASGGPGHWQYYEAPAI